MARIGDEVLLLGQVLSFGSDRVISEMRDENKCNRKTCEAHDKSDKEKFADRIDLHLSYL